MRVSPSPASAGEGCPQLGEHSEPSEGKVGVKPRDSSLTAILDEAQRHGIGVITATSASDYATWHTLVEPQRADPRPDDLNDFIALQLSAPSRERIARWMR